nr:NfeD family protein [Clostridia bacterium]
MPYIWISLAVFALIIETASLKYTALCFLVSSLGALVLSLAGLEIWVQTLVFFILTALFVTLRYTVLKKFLGSVNGRGIDPATLIGMQALVTQTIDNDENSGRVRLSGREWRAKANDGKMVYESGTRVTLLEYDPDFERFTCE